MNVINHRCLRDIGILYIEDYTDTQFRDGIYVGNYKVFYTDDFESWSDDMEELQRLKQFVKNAIEEDEEIHYEWRLYQ